MDHLVSMIFKAACYVLGWSLKVNLIFCTVKKVVQQNRAEDRFPWTRAKVLRYRGYSEFSQKLIAKKYKFLPPRTFLHSSQNHEDRVGKIDESWTFLVSLVGFNSKLYDLQWVPKSISTPN